MKRACLLSLCLLLGVLLPAKAVLLRGRIVDEAGQALEGAVIGDGSQRVFSAEDGSFQLLTEADSLAVSRMGFKARNVPSRGLSGAIVLQAEPVLLPRILVSESSLDDFSGAADLIRIPVDPDRHYYSASELLSSTTALSSADIRLKGETQNLSILGNLSRHSLILLDGVALNPNGASYDLSLLDPQNIASIELIKNNASVYGGGSAIGGIVQITTHRGSPVREQKGSLELEFGSFGYAKSAFTFNTSRSNWNLRLQLSDFSTDNDFPYQLRSWWAADSTARRENNAKRQSSVWAASSFRTGKILLSLQSEYQSFHRQLPGTVNFLEIYRRAFLKGFANRSKLSLDAKLLGWDWQTALWLNLDRTLYDNTQAPLAVFRSKNRQKMSYLGLRSSLDREFRLAPWFSLDGGLTAETGLNRYQNLDLLASATAPQHDIRFVNGSLKAGCKMDSGAFLWKNSAALRADHSGQDKMLSWRLESSLQHFSWLDTTLGATLGTSFALPSPYDLYWKGDSQALGNPELHSEKSRGWQLWLANQLGPVRIKAAWHHNSITDLIQWRQVQLNGNVWKPLNIGRARRQNLELEATFTPADWLALNASALYTRALDLSQGAPSSAPELMYTPKLSYACGLDLSWKNLGFWTKYSFTGEQWTTPDNLAQPLSAYALLDAGLNFALTLLDFQLSPQLSIQNILNKRYEVYSYVPQPGISFYTGLSLSKTE